MAREERYKILKPKVDKLRKTITKCPKCKGNGYYPTGRMIDNFTFETKTCDCKLKFFKEKDKILSNIPLKFRTVLETKLLQNRAVINYLTNERVPLFKKVIKTYLIKYGEAKRKGLGLMFFGDSGTGKTTAAMYILISLINRRIDGYYIFFKDLISLLLESYGEDLEKKALFKEITTVEFLVIDELSLVGRITPHMVAEFTSLCKQRFEEKLPTIIISNYQSLDEVFTNFGTPIESLLNEAFIPLKFKGRDLRTDKYEYMKDFFQ